MIQALLDGFTGPGMAFMYAITAVLAFGLAVALERTWVLWLRWRVDRAAVLAAVEAGEVDRARKLTAAHPIGPLVAAGAAREGDAAWDAMGAQAALIEAGVRQRIPYLAAVGNIATMLGLLGTVYGLIYAFSGINDASSVERTARLSAGIAAAMSTTAWGLLVGIPALAVHALIDGKASQLLAWCEAVASQVAAARRG